MQPLLRGGLHPFIIGFIDGIKVQMCRPGVRLSTKGVCTQDISAFTVFFIRR